MSIEPNAQNRERTTIDNGLKGIECCTSLNSLEDILKIQILWGSKRPLLGPEHHLKMLKIFKKILMPRGPKGFPTVLRKPKSTLQLEGQLNDFYKKTQTSKGFFWIDSSLKFVYDLLNTFYGCRIL